MFLQPSRVGSHKQEGDSTWASCVLYGFQSEGLSTFCFTLCCSRIFGERTAREDTVFPFIEKSRWPYNVEFKMCPKFFSYTVCAGVIQAIFILAYGTCAYRDGGTGTVLPLTQESPVFN